MKHKPVGLAIVLAVLALTLSLFSQERPDFSGTWKLDATKSNFLPAPKPTDDGRPGPPPTPLPAMLVITQTTEILTIDETSSRGIRRFTFKLDGTESNNWTGPIQMRSRSSWEDGKLVLSTTNFVEYDNFGNSTEVYGLQGGSLILEKTLNRRDGVIIKTKLVFTR